MKNRTITKVSIFAGIFLLANLAAAQTTAFTYQGRLNVAGAPANGSYDLTFTLYDDGTAGNLIAGPLTNAATTVSNGLFTVAIDFGAGIFTGTGYWLEVGAQTNGGSDYATLAPRQQITPTPYAIYSASAASVAADSITVGDLFTLVPPVDGQVLSFTGGSLSWMDPAVAGGSVWSLNGSSAYYSAGGVGIGTSNPKGALQLASGGLAVTGASSPYTGAGKGAFLEYNGTYGGILFAYDYGAGAPLNLLLNSPGGNVGIGTVTPSAKLTVSDSVSVSHRIETSGGVNAWARLEFANGNGQWDVGTSRGYNGDQLYFYREGASVNAFAIQPNGNSAFAGSLSVGKTSQPQFALDVNGAVNAGSGLLVTGASSPNYPNTKGVYIEKADYSPGLSYGAIYAYNYNNPSPHAMSLSINGPGGNVGIGTISPAYTLDVNGTTRTHSIIITGGADVAEPFKMGGAELSKGSVVVIDKEHPGELKLSSRAYDKTVAGIVSGANGITPGIALHQEGAIEGGQNVALSGRVYVQADASNGAIEPGDLLTTSATPGFAMKVTEAARAQGAIIGKAMTGLAEGKGTVLVLVSLQ